MCCIILNLSAFNSQAEGTITGAAISPNLHLPILEGFQCIKVSPFIIPSGIMNKKACMQYFGNPTWNVFLAASRDHEFLLDHRGTELHASHFSTIMSESQVPGSNAHTQVLSSDPSDSITPNLHCKKNRCPDRVSRSNKMALRNTIQTVNFADPAQTRMAHETLMHYVNRELRCLSIAYSMQIDPLYFEQDKFIPTLENHFLTCWKTLLNHDHQRYASVNNEGQSIPVSSSELNTSLSCGVTDGGQAKRHTAPDFHNWKPEAELNNVKPFATAD